MPLERGGKWETKVLMRTLGSHVPYYSPTSLPMIDIYEAIASQEHKSTTVKAAVAGSIPTQRDKIFNISILNFERNLTETNLHWFMYWIKKQLELNA